jgi:hypothetical protein
LQTPAVRRMFPLQSPIEARTESFKEEEVVVTKYEDISSNNITIKLETKVLRGKIMLKGPPAAHLSTVHMQTLVNCKLLLLGNNVN